MVKLFSACRLVGAILAVPALPYWAINLPFMLEGKTLATSVGGHSMVVIHHVTFWMLVIGLPVLLLGWVGKLLTRQS